MGVDVLLDDRDERVGVLLNDSELIGYPFRIVVGERSLSRGVIEFKRRGIDGSEYFEYSLDAVMSRLK